MDSDCESCYYRNGDVIWTGGKLNDCEARGKVMKSDGIRLPNDRVIKSIHKDSSYEYLGISHSDQVL